MKALILIASNCIVLAQVSTVQSPSAAPPAAMDAIGRLTLDGALVIAVGVLWKALVALAAKSDLRIAEKDKLLFDMAVKVTETMVKVTETMLKVNETVGTVQDSLTELRVALADVKTGLRSAPPPGDDGLLRDRPRR